MDPDQTARMRRLVWIHAGGKPITLVCRDAAQYFMNIIAIGMKVVISLFGAM
jgi:hypothetical protein